MWTGVISESLYESLEGSSLLLEEKKGYKNRSRRSKDQLSTDKAILRDLKIRNTNFSASLVNSRKTCDMMLHSWIKQYFEKFKVSDKVTQFLVKSMRI